MSNFTTENMNVTTDAWGFGSINFGDSVDSNFLFKSLDKTLKEKAEIQKMCTTALEIQKIYTWILFGIGFPTNILVMITILSMHAVSPATFFVALLAFFDGAALLLKLLTFQLDFYEVEIGAVGCKFQFLTTFATISANWILVLICLERFVSVCFPLKKVYLFTKRRSYISAAVTVSVLFAITATIYFIMRTSWTDNTKCTVDMKYIDFWRNYWFYINAALLIFIPFLLLVILNIGTIRGLQTSRKHRRSLMGNSGSGKGITGSDSAVLNNQRLIAETERVERTITIMIILAAVLFLILTTPACVYYLGRENLSAYCHDSMEEARWEIYNQVQSLLIDATHALNFFIYFFAAKRFRDHLLKLLTCKVCRKVKYRTRFQGTQSTSIGSCNRVTLSNCPQTPTSVNAPRPSLISANSAV